MFLDMLLKILGENPSGYPTASDKVAILLVYILNYSMWILPIIFFVIPYVFLFVKYKKKGKITKKLIIRIVVLSLIAGIFGYFIPVLINNLMIGYAVRSFYGGQV